MRYLSEIIQDQQSAAFEKHGAFFAFSRVEFEERRQSDVKYTSIYTSMYGGLFCPKDNADALHEELGQIAKTGIEQDIEEHGITNIIIRELDNHEYGVTLDITDTVAALEDYPGIDAALVDQVARNRKMQA